MLVWIWRCELYVCQGIAGIDKEGKVKKSAIDDAVRNILRIKFRLGLFDNPYVDEKRIEELYAPSHLEAAKQAAVESAILLKNEKKTLPLQSSVKTVAVVGAHGKCNLSPIGYLDI